MKDLDDGPDADAEQLPPSKSARKRSAHAAQKLGEQLLGMRAQDLAGLPLPEDLREAIAEARRLTSRGARVRQLQYIGRLMRVVDLAALESALAAQAEAQNARARLRR
jgi:ribosome-associated protein